MRSFRGGSSPPRGRYERLFGVNPDRRDVDGCRAPCWHFRNGSFLSPVSPHPFLTLGSSQIEQTGTVFPLTSHGDQPNNRVKAIFDTAAGNGGGVFIDDMAGESATLTNVTITNNRAHIGSSGSGGVIDQAAGIVTLGNTIVAGNFTGASGTTADDVKRTLSASSSFNLFGTGGSGGLTSANNNQINVANPGLAGLANNGGPTQTVALLAGSPALDAGSNALATAAGLTADQRGTGFTRFADGPDADTT